MDTTWWEQEQGVLWWGWRFHDLVEREAYCWPRLWERCQRRVLPGGRGALCNACRMCFAGAACRKFLGRQDPPPPREREQEPAKYQRYLFGLEYIVVCAGSRISA